MTTYSELTRSTEEESKKFRKALDKLLFSREEFIKKGPAVIFEKFDECMKELKENNKKLP